MTKLQEIKNKIKEWKEKIKECEETKDLLKRDIKKFEEEMVKYEDSRVFDLAEYIHEISCPYKTYRCCNFSLEKLWTDGEHKIALEMARKIKDMLED